MFEVELKYPVTSHDRIRQQLLTMESTQTGISKHCDEYFNQTLLDFAGNDIALRIRSAEDSHTLTYKGPNLDSRAKVREEIEIQLGTEDKDKFRDILLGMGFHSVLCVQKQRDSMALHWKDDDVVVCLDTIEGIGSFVELELVVKSKEQVGSAKATLESLAKTLGITSEPTTVSYLEMLLERQENSSA